MEEINIKAIEKQIDYEISIKNNFWNATVLSFGSTLGLFFLPDNCTKLIFIIFGILFSIAFLKCYLFRFELIQCLINKLNKMR